MTDTAEQRRTAFQNLLAEKSLSRGEAAELLHVSEHTVNGWLKPSNPNQVPAWAVELLTLKTRKARK